MCEPATIIAGASLAIGVGSQVANAKEQDKASKQNKEAALAAMAESWRDLSLREHQEQDAKALTIAQADRQAREADALARVSAGEAGVSGASVDALLSDISADASRFKTTAEQNLDMTITQLQQEKRGVAAGAGNRIAASPPSNPFATALQIGALGLDFATTLTSRKPAKATTPKTATI